MAVATPSQTTLLTRWLFLNLFRLLGVVAIAWSIGIQVVLLLSDARGGSPAGFTSPASGNSTSQVAGLNVTTSVASSIYPSNAVSTLPTPVSYTQTGLGSTVPGSSSAGLEESLLQAIETGGLGIVPTAGSAANGPLALYPTSVDIPTAAITPPPILNLPPGMQAIGKRAEPEKTGNNSSKASPDDRYFTETTVPQQSGGLIFAIVQRVEFCIALAVLFLGQIGWPEKFLLMQLPPLGMRSSGLALGCGKVWLGTEMQRHFVATAHRTPGLLLLCSGAIDIVIATILKFRQSRKNKGQLEAKRDIYLRFQIAQRLFFWTDLPAEAFYGIDAFGKSAGLDDPSQYGHEKCPASPEYPTFANGSLDDPESHIPGMTGEKEISFMRRGSSSLTDDEDDDLSEELIENTRLNAANGMDDRTPPRLQSVRAHPARTAPPQIPREISSLPDSIQQMVQGVQPRFAAGQAVPQIQLEPSTPSTIASGKQSVNFPRPDSMFSTTSGATVRSASTPKLISSAVQEFPEPPKRTAAPGRSRPKQHLVHKPMDKSKLMPPKKSALKRQSQFAGAPPVHQSTSVDEVMGNAADARELSRRSMVRFDLHRMSVDSTLSTASSSSAESLLAGIIPAKPPAAKATRDRAPSRQEQPPLSMHMSESDSIYDGIVQQAHRADLNGSSLVRRKGTKPNSPSRLSYLLSDDSSPNSPFADPETPDSPFADTHAEPLTQSELDDEAFLAKRNKRMSHLAV